MIYNGKATNALVGKRPQCQFCVDPSPAVVDGKTQWGPWGYMCTNHYTEYGVGLGEGVGQVLLCDDGLDKALIARYNLGNDAARGGAST